MRSIAPLFYCSHLSVRLRQCTQHVGQNFQLWLLRRLHKTLFFIRDTTPQKNQVVLDIAFGCFILSYPKLC